MYIKYADSEGDSYIVLEKQLKLSPFVLLHFFDLKNIEWRRGEILRYGSRWSQVRVLSSSPKVNLDVAQSVEQRKCAFFACSLNLNN